MEESLEWVLRSGKQWDDGREFHFGIFHSPSGAFVGGVGLNELRPEHRLANLGYWVRSAWARRGVATAAARLAAQFGFEELLLDRIEILAAFGNKGSQRVAQKLGALREGVLRNRLVIHGQAHDAVVFSLLGSEWKLSDNWSPLRRGDAESTVESREEGHVKRDQDVEMTTKRAMNPAPITLEGQYARLEPLDAKHAEGLFAIGQDEKIWRYLLRPKLESVADALGFVEEALNWQPQAHSYRSRSSIRKAIGWPAQRDIWTFAQTTGRLRLAPHGSGASFNAPPSTPNASTCFCATPLRNWVQYA